MPKGRTPQDILDDLRFVSELDKTPWRQGIVETAVDLAREVGELEQQKQQLVADIDAKMKNRMKVLRSLPGRVAREVELIYTEEQVEAAKESAACAPPDAPMPD